MKLANPKAFVPFMTDEVVITISSDRTNVDLLAIKASVCKGNPYASNIGNAQTGEQWTVAMIESDVVSPAKFSRGNQVEADKIGCRWPRLTVQGVYPLGGIVTLLCSGKERGGM